MNTILTITGNVRFSLTLDPSTWIFDDRKIEEKDFFSVSEEKLEDYTEVMSKHWSREIQEGQAFPPTLKTEKRYEKEKLVTSTYGILLHPFIMNAEPGEDAMEIEIVTKEKSYYFPLEKVNSMLLCFSKLGKPIKENGPVLLYFRDGSNKDKPISSIERFTIH
ncbi:hypothetical protein Q73_04860 [Bacillus coahuilensis m2-6]|uniref:hypothetical protein n=1 Tax=Bacillus coahuilensis TaxID=408580 RepID=UPI00075047E9|nr:hypothetical protein [Bacillus coahuilensis]KUP08808.1 hypothetical protein Q73_04860 [Bacillus coahuilensis m2-6]